MTDRQTFDESKVNRGPDGKFRDKPKELASMPKASKEYSPWIEWLGLAPIMSGEDVRDVFRELDNDCLTDRERRELRDLYSGLMERNGYDDINERIAEGGIDLREDGDTIYDVYDPDTYEAGDYRFHGYTCNYELTLDKPAGDVDMGDTADQLIDIGFRDDPQIAFEEANPIACAQAKARFTREGPDEAKIQFLHDYVDHMVNDPDFEAGYMFGIYHAVPSDQAMEYLHYIGMTDEAIQEAKHYGGWDPSKDECVRFTEGGDLEGLSKKDADRLVWDNRDEIIGDNGDSTLTPELMWRMRHV